MASNKPKRIFLLCLLLCVTLLLGLYSLRIRPVIKTITFVSPPPAQAWNTLEMETNEVVIGMFQMFGLKAQMGAGRRRESLDTVFEVPLMRYVPLEDALYLPDHKRSKVFLLTPRDRLSVGAIVQFRVDLFNGYGQPRVTDGDEIRAWLKSQDSKSSVAAKVKDLHNGSYVGESVLPWSGVTSVQVSLTYAREFLRLSVELYHSLHSMRYTTEVFKSGKIKERVPCLPSIPIPGYNSTCNFTASNGGRPWYCGRPQDSRLNCTQRSVYSNLPYTWPLPIPSALKAYVTMLNRCCRKNNTRPNLRLIPNNITLWAPVEKTSPTQPLPPCYRRPVRESWVSPSPRGWLRNGTWIPSTCTLPALTTERVQRCLRNTTLLLLGDSNQRFLWYEIADKLGCPPVGKNQARIAPHLCKNDTWQTTLLFVTHAFPFSPAVNLGFNGFPQANLPLPLALQQIEKLAHHDPLHNENSSSSSNINKNSNKRLFVVLHYYLHLAAFPVQVFRSMVRAARQTVQEYLKVHRDVKFVIRGPHVVYSANNFHVHMGDKFAHWYMAILKKEFAPLADRVWYLDTWDLTLASENTQIHPLSSLPEIAKMLFGYMCDAD